MRRRHADMDAERRGEPAGGDDLLAAADLVDEREGRVVDRRRPRDGRRLGGCDAALERVLGRL